MPAARRHIHRAPAVAAPAPVIAVIAISAAASRPCGGQDHPQPLLALPPLLLLPLLPLPPLCHTDGGPGSPCGWHPPFPPHVAPTLRPPTTALP